MCGVSGWVCVWARSVDPSDWRLTILHGDMLDAAASRRKRRRVRRVRGRVRHAAAGPVGLDDDRRGRGQAPGSRRSRRCCRLVLGSGARAHVPQEEQHDPHQEEHEHRPPKQRRVLLLLLRRRRGGCMGCWGCLGWGCRLRPAPQRGGRAAVGGIGCHPRACLEIAMGVESRIRFEASRAQRINPNTHGTCVRHQSASGGGNWRVEVCMHWGPSQHVPRMESASPLIESVTPRRRRTFRSWTIDQGRWDRFDRFDW